jgi:dynein heavy chain, axonemal
LEAIEMISEFWISLKSASKELELTKLKYKIPTQFFSLQPKMATLLQALENISHLQLELPEACHLLQSSETILGDDLYVVSRLSKVLDALPSSKANPKLYSRPLTPFESPNVANINTNSVNPLVHETNVFSSLNYNAIQNKKFGELNDYCSSILNSKLPKAYTKEQIAEKVKKHGSNAYMDWIANEMTLLSNLINTIKNQVTVSLDSFVFTFILKSY